MYKRAYNQSSVHSPIILQDSQYGKTQGPFMMTSSKSKVLLVGSGGIGTIAALNLERGGLAEVSSVLRSNFKVVYNKGFTIRSCEHGDVQNWRPTESQFSFPFQDPPALLTMSESVTYSLECHPQCPSLCN